MRLHTLSMTAIGPYVGTERVDFDALGADGLFLFTGPTGAGKSTVLDAVTYALYGKLPGTRDGHLSRLKSDFAAPDVAPEVVLEVTIGGDRLRIHRSPAFERPSKRDPHKLTTQRSSVSLERRVDGVWLGIEGARKEQVANEWLHEKIGLNADQFTQVVLLPQGQFAEFLHADDDVREKLLTSLFDAHRFKQVEDWFEDRQRIETAAAVEAQAKVATLRTRAQAIADLVDGDVPEAADLRFFDDLADRYAELAGEAGVRLDVAEKLHTEALARLRDGEAVAALHAERDDAIQRRDALHARSEEISELRERVARAVRAANVQPLLQAVTNRHEAADASAAVLAASRERLSESARELDAVGLSRRGKELTAERGALTELIAAEASLPALESSVAAAADAAEQATLTAQGLRDERQALPAARSAAVETLGQLREQAAVLDDARGAETALTAALKAARELIKLDARLSEARQFERAMTDDVLAAREGLVGLRERRVAGMAAELARELRTGQPCDVCGSTEHPRPARPAADAPTPSDIADAEKHLDVCRELVRGAQQSVADLAAKHAAHAAIAAGRAVDELKALVADATERRTAAQSAAASIADAEAELQRLDLLLAQADDRIRVASIAEQERAAEHRDLLTEQRRVAARVETARGAHETVAELARAIDDEIEVIEAYVAAAAADEAANRELVAATSAAASAASDAGFVSADDAAAAVLSARRLEEAGGTLSAFDADYAAVTARLADPRLVELPAATIDLDPLRVAEAAARQTVREAHAVHQKHADRFDRLSKVAEQARDDVADALAGANRAARVKDLALLIRGMGSNAKKMNLTAYFLAARLEQVTAVASGHLQAMSSGRYTLRHTDERRTGRGHGGLGLVVFDAFTGKARPPHSLSGGETFIASLSLALGLAEVVTAETGAMTLDSLFIDEGFGSLDSDTLEQAMQVLDGLRQVGRTIGVISHVEEMRSRIGTQLVIERTDHGSRVLPH